MRGWRFPSTRSRRWPYLQQPPATCDIAAPGCQVLVACPAEAADWRKGLREGSLRGLGWKRGYRLGCHFHLRLWPADPEMAPAATSLDRETVPYCHCCPQPLGHLQHSGRKGMVHGCAQV